MTRLPPITSPERTLETFLHVALFLKSGQVLGDETFRLVSFQGQEQVSSPFEYQLELHADSASAAPLQVDFSELLGQGVTVGIQAIELPEVSAEDWREQASNSFVQAVAGADESQSLVLFNGIVASFSQSSPGVYHVMMRPSIWTLTLTNAYRVLPQMSVRDAIENLLKQHGVSYNCDALMGQDNIAITRTQDWLQAGESDYELLQRLMSKAHIYYFVKSTGNAHQVVFANRPAYPMALPDGRPMRYAYSWQDVQGPIQPDTLTQYKLEHSLTSSSVSTVFTREESAVEQDEVASYQSYVSDTSSQQIRPFRQYLIYQYGCSGSETDHFASQTRDTLETSRLTLNGGSHSPHLRVGHQFRTTQYPRAEQKPAPLVEPLEGAQWVVTQVQHQASITGSYENSFKAVPAGGLITPFEMSATQQGAVLAKVVATHTSAEAPQDWRFYKSDVYAPQDQTVGDSAAGASPTPFKGVCVVFSTDTEEACPTWVKLSAGMETVPEVGAMVLVARSQDQSELPVVQSILGSHGNSAATPTGWIPSNSVSSSYNTSYGDSVAIHFGRYSNADLAKAQKLVTDSYGTGKFRDTSYSQGASYSYSTSENGASGLLSESYAYGSSQSETKGDFNNSKSSFINTTNTSEVTGKSVNSSTTAIAENTNIQGFATSSNTTGSSMAADVTGASVNTSVTGLATSSSATGARAQLNLEGVSKGVSLTGLSNNVSLTGESSNVAVTGVSKQISATGSSTGVDVVGMSTHASLTGMETAARLVGISTNASLTGISTGVNLTGVTTDVGVVGVSSRVNVTGVNTGVNVVGVSTDVNVAGVTTNVSVKGVATNIDVTGAGISVQVAAAMVSANITGISVDIPLIKIIL